MEMRRGRGGAVWGLTQELTPKLSKDARFGDRSTGRPIRLLLEGPRRARRAIDGPRRVALPFPMCAAYKRLGAWCGTSFRTRQRQALNLYRLEIPDSQTRSAVNRQRTTAKQSRAKKIHFQLSHFSHLPRVAHELQRMQIEMVFKCCMLRKKQKYYIDNSENINFQMILSSSLHAMFVYFLLDVFFRLTILFTL